MSFPVDDKGVFFFLLPVMSFPKSVVGNLKVFCGTSPSPSLSPREGEGKKSREVTNEKGVHKCFYQDILSCSCQDKMSSNC